MSDRSLGRLPQEAAAYVRALAAGEATAAEPRHASTVVLLREDLLRPWAHWITPEVEPKRFDTRFFVAALPTGQRTRDVGGEADRVAWVRPADALAAADSGEMGMLPPTAFTLSELATYDDVAAVLAAGTARDVKPVLPKIVLGDDDEARLLLPHDEGYPGT